VDTLSSPVIWVPSEVPLAEEVFAALPRVSLCSYVDIDELGSDCRDVALMSPDNARRFLNRDYCPEVRLVLWLGKDLTADQSLLTHTNVCAAIGVDSTREAIVTAFKTALDLCSRDRQHFRTAETLEKVLEIGRALASEKDLDTLLDLVLTQARRLIGADGASIYTRDKAGKLYFRLLQNASTQSTSKAQMTLVGDYSVAGYVARTGETVNVDDAYQIAEDAPYSFNPASDHSLNYRTRSMLTLPLTNKANDVVGVLQLINRKRDHETPLLAPADFENKVLPFDEPSVALAQALAGQAGVALENSILYEDIEKLFEGFIRASVQAIEARDPTTAGHSFRVAEFTERLAKAADRSDIRSVSGIQFSRDQLQEIRYAALLHDFGKVGVRENVLVKADKLYPHQLQLIEQRFQFARTSLGRHAFREILDWYESGEVSVEELQDRRRRIEAMLAEEDERLQRFFQTVIEANRPSVLHEDASAGLEAIRQYQFPGHEGEPLPLLEEFEFTSLSLSKGSLSPEERVQIESHVSHTFEFLSLIPWTRNLANLPNIAYAHHEKLDGTGYPRHLAAQDIPVQSRIMTIADIYDALTAPDRPYKKAVPADRALDILSAEAGAGKIDSDLFQIFVESNSFVLIDA
jgi:HD-GYP domain-containing protein (c-di-GMP phosphodiesterase class II)